MSWLLLMQAAATLWMTGLIWFVQIVHYPLMSGVGVEGFVQYEALHSERTTWVVGPPMLLELACAAALLFRAPPEIPRWQSWLGFALVAVIWMSTALLQVPRHRQLGAGFDAGAHAALVATNWIRTVAWSARACLVLYWLR